MTRFGIMAMLVFAFGSRAMAQDELPMRGPGAERVEQYKKIRLMETLSLDEETSIRFFARYHRHREELRKLNMRRNSLIDELQTLRRREASDAEYKKVLEELRKLADPAVEIREQYFDEIGKILTPKQMAEYVIFERSFLQNLREIMRDMQRNRRGPRIR
ncbi:MAG: hypothetical protein HYW57_00955 [Ignavibacteriales bacterium]|nr:hypothetical protein [Ignavibacteriales bacterium]